MSARSKFRGNLRKEDENQKRGTGECQSLWQNAEGHREGGGFACDSAPVILSSTVF